MTLLLVGGYERGECLDSVESYDPQTNRWASLPSMKTARGRFDIAQVGSRLYACGGSNGQRDLRSAEVYGAGERVWKPLPDMTYERSSPAVTSLGRRVYVIGGFSGSIPIKKCEVFDSETNHWSSIADLPTGASSLRSYQMKNSVNCFSIVMLLLFISLQGAVRQAFVRTEARSTCWAVVSRGRAPTRFCATTPKQTSG